MSGFLGSASKNFFLGFGRSNIRRVINQNVKYLPSAIGLANTAWGWSQSNKKETDHLSALGGISSAFVGASPLGVGCFAFSATIVTFEFVTQLKAAEAQKKEASVDFMVGHSSLTFGLAESFIPSSKIKTILTFAPLLYDLTKSYKTWCKDPTHTRLQDILPGAKITSYEQGVSSEQSHTKIISQTRLFLPGADIIYSGIPTPPKPTDI